METPDADLLLVKHQLPCDGYTVTQEGPDPSQG